jgi:hypothetical protein
MPDYRPSYVNQVPTLKDLVVQKQNMDELAQKQQQTQAEMAQKEQLAKAQQQFELQKQQEAEDIAGAGAMSRLETVKKESKANPSMKIMLGKDSAEMAPSSALMTTDYRREKDIQKQAQDLSKRYEKSSGFHTALTELENISNRDGSGGVLSNPNAKLISTGPMKSAVPESALGLAELTGAVPKGTMEERKSLQRLALEYRKAMSGLRGSDKLYEQERQAMGLVSSGDPALVSKGARSLARSYREQLKKVQGGYTPEARDQAHSLSGDPLNDFSGLYEDKPMQQPSINKSRQQMSQTQVVPQQASQVQETPEQELARLKAKYKR